MDVYTKFYNSFLFPFYESFLRRRNTLKYFNKLEKSQWLSEEELEDIQWGKLKNLLKHAYDNVPYYRNVFKKIRLNPSDIKNAEDFSKVPFLTKDDIRNNQKTLIAVNYKNKKVYTKVTGGSTGTPLQFKLDHTNYEWRQAGVKRTYGWTGYKDGEKTVYIWGASVVKEPFFKKLKHDWDEKLKRHKIYNTFYFTEEMMKICINDINRFRPRFIIAYTTPLYLLAQFIKDNNKHIFSPRSIIVGAEKLFSYQRKIIKDVFSCPVYETYGCREVTSIAGECDKHKGMHINMENIYLEVINRNKPVASGERGEIVITDLTNYCMPFIRYKNDDIGSLSSKKCGCGRGLKILDKVEGRVLDTIKTSDGRLIPGEFFIYWFMGFDEIKQFQVVQGDLDNLVIKIVSRKDFSKDRIDKLKKIIHDIMGKKLFVDFQFVNEISLTSSGKFRVVVSKVPIEFSGEQKISIYEK